MQCGSSSTVGLTVPKMLAPVVVKPDTVSKSASAKDFVTPENMKGSEPKILRKIQESATITKPSLEYSFELLGFLITSSAPTAPDMSIDQKKANVAFSVYIIPVARGSKKNAVSKSKSQPSVYFIIL
jgi:hypothetical protein